MPSPPRRRRRGLVFALIGMVLVPAILFGVFAASMLRIKHETTGQATRIMHACSPYGDESACREALGPESTPELVAHLQLMMATAEQESGDFRELNAIGVCSRSTPEGSHRELRARVDWARGREAVVFQWREAAGGWQLAAIAAAETVPPLCG